MAYNTTYGGTQIGNYRVTSQLASGGFGSVYLAQHVILSGRIAAFKVLHAVYLSAPHERESFFQEAQLLEKLKHAYILPILDVGLYQNMVPLTSVVNCLRCRTYFHTHLLFCWQKATFCALPLYAVTNLLGALGYHINYS